MALTAVTVFDIAGATQTITFNDPSQVDQISFGSNQITYQSSSAYNLSKADLLLYYKYLNAFNTLLFVNFPSIVSSVNLAWPLSVFDITTSNVGVKKIIYNQTSQGTTVINIDYVPIAVAASFATRASPVTISLQEFYMNVYMLAQFINQVSVN